MPDIRGLQKFSLIDYPDHLSCIVFLFGCNFRCHYCQNPELVEERGIPKINEGEIFSFLKERQEYLEGVVITGGEPTLQRDLIPFIKKIKDLGFLVKLDTNGTKPSIIKKLIDQNLVDYISLDIKAPLEKYSQIVGVESEKEKIVESMKAIMNSKKDYEFRTTVLPKLLNEKDILKIGKEIKGAKKYVLQNFKPSKTLNPNYKNEKSYTLKELEKFKQQISKKIGFVKVRN